ncbi:MAG: glycosyltransferase family 87 protein [Terracidiphilus sp.]|nr:glycosyltransferase family 87 protein [Terracidiphilus sp.]
MSGARRDGLMLLLLGSVVFVFLGLALERASHEPMVDFRVMYYPARCLVQHGDPYNQAQVLSLYRAMAADNPSDSEKVRQIATRYIYLPSAFCFTVPLALLPWGPAHILWLLFTMGGLIFASFLVWNLAADYAPVATGALLCLFLANSELLIISTNAAGIVVSLCAVAVWCFLRERFVPAGILCLALALAIKPQDSGLVWLYFLLVGGLYRKHAVQTLLVTAALSLPALLWVWHAAPGWAQEWQSNIAILSARGGISDPGPTSLGGHGLANVISLQSVISVFRDDPRVYNSVSYLVCAPLLIVWMAVTLRSRGTRVRTWLALAGVAALTMLPFYHRQYDAKLLLLAIPACAMLWAKGGLAGRLSLLVTLAALLFTGDLTWALFLALVQRLPLLPAGFWAQLRVVLQVFPAPLSLLILGIFYLVVYARKAPGPAPGAAIRS